MGNRKSYVLLWIAAVLALLTGADQITLYLYARSHLTEILRNGSVKILNGFLTVTEEAALANPPLTTAVFCFVLSAACFAGLYVLKRRKK